MPADGRMDAGVDVEKAVLDERFLRSVRGNYENFSIAAVFLPGGIRRDLWNIYTFSRIADDLADESDDTSIALAELDRWGFLFDETLAGRGKIPFLQDIADTIKRNGLSVQYFHNLLTAFRQDLRKTRYFTWDELRDYTRHSADPIGRLILELFGLRDPANFAHSDKICTALQLINHLQDIRRDWVHGRFYFPLDELAAFHASLTDLDRGRLSPEFKSYLKHQANRARQLMNEGQRLFTFVPRRLRIQLALYINGGMAALNRVQRYDFDYWTGGIKLNRLEKAAVVIRSLMKGLTV